MNIDEPTIDLEADETLLVPDNPLPADQEWENPVVEGLLGSKTDLLDGISDPQFDETEETRGDPDWPVDDNSRSSTIDNEQEARAARQRAARLRIDANLGGSGTAAAKKNSILKGFPLELMERRLINERKAVSIALQTRASGKTFFRTLAQERGMGNLEDIYRALGERVGQQPIEAKGELFDRLYHADWLSAGQAEQRAILPLISPDPDVTAFAAIDPLDVVDQDWVQRQSKQSTVVVPILPDLFWEGLSRYKKLDLDNVKESELFIPIDISWSKEEEVQADFADWDIPVVVNYIIHRSFEQGASDVHVEPTGDDLTIRYRVDGMLHEQARLPASMHAPVTSRIKVLADLDVAETRRPQDGRMSVAIRDRPIDIRVSTLPMVAGEKVVMRLLDESALRPRPERLGLSDRDLQLLLDKVSAPLGMILLSGPTGSGKTTTLYSCLSAIDRISRNVVTVEDPVEYRLKGVHQMQVNEAIGMTFATGLRTMLRQDPDVIMVGECRDVETSAMAIQAALTGHLVFTTIHSNSAIGAVGRLVDMKIDRFLIANALSLSIAQRLLRCTCKHCQTTVDGREIIAGLRSEGISVEKLAHLGIDIDPDQPCPTTTGCPRCRHTGFSGRQAVFEMFSMTDEARLCLVSDRFDLAEFRQITKDQGMSTMLRSGMALVDEGRTSYSEVVRVLGEM
ncbi:MAG: type II/IV secretion system protein [Rhodospirillaceae bacterium]|nr:type II/IV secretion system protein [Rhodospirillaceae bacterium]MBT5897572.1 type II/IV secretion system protein [Rhodospirillaceae bacterium]MBT6429960.1 type II/IV secretion system protein [Rhodospirillaceae bacterium]MBT7758321.1 type II/IV secretion system protein [Rhodospirillaceae bacterium]